MYRIAVLAEQEAERQRYAEQITRFCEAKGLFPQVMQYDDQERFFETAQKEAPTNAVIALSGATYGEKAFPEEWKKVLQSSPLGEKRPPDYQPHNIFLIAEKLIVSCI